MKQELRVSLFFMFCVFGLMFSTTQAFGGFEPNLVGEQQRELNKDNQSIDKDKKVSKQQAQKNRKNRKRFRTILKNIDKDEIRKLSKRTLYLGILSAIFLGLMTIADIFILPALVAAIAATIIGIKTLKRIKKSEENHKIDKIFITIGLLLSFFPTILYSLFYIYLMIVWVA